MIHRRYLHLAVILCLCACASGQSGQTERRARDMSVLTTEDLQGQTGITLYDLIQRSRPNWLRVRGTTSLTLRPDEIAVYRDGQRVGGPSTLRDFTVESVEKVVYLSGPEASSRFGLDHQNGAILVTTRMR